MTDDENSEPIHSGTRRAHLALVDRLLFPIWVAAMAGFLLWLVTLGVNV